MTPIMLQNGFFVCACVIAGWLCVCVDRRSREAHIQASNKPRLRIIMTQRYNDTERQASILVLPHAADWWLHSGFLHTTNWIHRSLDKVHEWDCYSLKTEGGESETGKQQTGCERGNTDEVVWFRTNEISSPSAAPPKPCSPTQRGVDR